MKIDVPAEHPPAPIAPAKQRVLDAADRLFTRDGVRAVGVDWLIDESRVTKATFYKHFRAKERLVLDYVAARRSRVAGALAERLDRIDDPEEALREVLASMLDELRDPEARGCAFIAVATEHPDRSHPVRDEVRRQREWLTALLERLLGALGHPMPGEAADDLLIARDGALMGGYAGDDVAAAAALSRAFERTITAAR